MAEPKIPEAKDDDPEDVSDKLSIASAMWARGDRADAVNWLRRAAESASDADLDLRALELAKMASELTGLLEPVPAPPPAAPAPKPQTAAPRPPQTAAPAAPKPPPKPSVRPPSSRPPGGKLPPLPPLRPLGSSPTQQPKAPAPRIPSMMSSVSGMSSASGTIEKSEPEPPPPAPGAEASTKPMPWDERDDEPTHQIALHEPSVKVDEERDLDATAVHDAVDPKLLQAMRQGAASDGAIRAAAVVEAPKPPEPQASEPPPTRVAYSEDARSTREPPYLPLAVGVRVRLVVAADGLRVVPDDGSIDGGTAAILVPSNPDDDLRTLFSRAALR